MGMELLTPENKARTLAANIRRDLGRLQIAILRENKHDISTHLGAAIERSEELNQVMTDAALLKAR
jgi:hypothetical protein